MQGCLMRVYIQLFTQPNFKTFSGSKLPASGRSAWLAKLTAGGGAALRRGYIQLFHSGPLQAFFLRSWQPV